MRRLRRYFFCFFAMLMACYGQQPGKSSLQNHTAESAISDALRRTMSGVNGSALVMEVTTGRLVAEVRPDKNALQLSAPGSTLKPFVLLHLLRSGHWISDRRLLCLRKFTIGRHRMDCSHPATSEPLDAVTALAFSCNSYFAQAVTATQPEELWQALRKAGLDTTSHLAEKEAAVELRRPRSVQEEQLLALGEEGVRLTPYILAKAYQRLAIEIVQHPDDAALRTVHNGMLLAVQEGMASEAYSLGTSAAGKTGTVVDSRGIQVGWFVGFAPADAPHYLVLIFLEQGRGLDAAARAKPVFEAMTGGSGSRQR